MNAALCMDLDAGSRAKSLPRRSAGRAGAAQAAPALPADVIQRPGAQELLHKWSELRTLIPEVVSKLRGVFGPATQIALERFDDPEAEAEGEEPSLYLVIGTKMTALEARQALDRFEDEWWIDNAERSNGHLHVSVDFL